MRKKLKWLTVLLVLVLVMGSLAACGDKKDSKGNPDVSEAQVPEAVQAIKDQVTGLVANNVISLNGAFGDQLDALIASDQGQADPNYAVLLEKLTQIRQQTGAIRVFTLVDKDPKDKQYNLLLDASDSPGQYMSPVDMEGHYTDAMNGNPIASLYARNDQDGNPCWTAVAPIYDTQGAIVAILGITIAAPDVKNYPEWNRDNKKWNGICY